jgi:uncharacterized membrane protein
VGALAGKGSGGVKPARPLDADLFEKFLAGGAAIIFLAAVTAIARGYGTWDQIPPVIWGHLVTILVATGLTPVMLLRRRGDARHRAIGWIWVGAMTATAVTSLFIGGFSGGGWSVIHILSVFTLVQLPMIVLSARAHRHDRHRSAVRGLVFGALLIAGSFTFPFGRLLGNWLFG